jgi:serine/threonine-protein kinase
MTVILNNRYRILEILGSGGFGQTFLSEDVHLPSVRKCVVKQLKPATHDLSIWRLIQERFQREAAILEMLGRISDQIPELYAYFTEEDKFYLVQELVEGGTLKQEVQSKGAFNESRSREILLSLLSVLESVHSHGIIHRDIKPDNIIIRKHDDKPVLIDFGAVKEIVSNRLDSDGSPTSSIRIGSPGFMPLEQAAGKPVFASDLYSLAATTVYLLTGKSPQALTDPATGEISWRPLVPNLSEYFASAIEKALEPDFRSRFKTAREMIAALEKDQFCVDQVLTGTNALAGAGKSLATTLATPERTRRIIVGTPVPNRPDGGASPTGATPNRSSLEAGVASSQQSPAHRSLQLLAARGNRAKKRRIIAALAALSCLIAIAAGLAYYYRRTHSSPGNLSESADKDRASASPTAPATISQSPTTEPAVSGSPALSPDQESTVSVAGQWSVTISADNEDDKAILTLRQDGNDLTGHVSYEEDDKTTTLSLTGNITANRILLTVFHKFTKKEIEDNKDDEESSGARSITIVFTGVVQETKMSGSVTGLTDNRKNVGNGKWTATKL